MFNHYSSKTEKYMNECKKNRKYIYTKVVKQPKVRFNAGQHKIQQTNKQTNRNHRQTCEFRKEPSRCRKHGKQWRSNIDERLLVRTPGRLLPSIPDGVAGQKD